MSFLDFLAEGPPASKSQANLRQSSPAKADVNKDKDLPASGMSFMDFLKTAPPPGSPAAQRPPHRDGKSSLKDTNPGGKKGMSFLEILVEPPTKSEKVAKGTRPLSGTVSTTSQDESDEEGGVSFMDMLRQKPASVKTRPSISGGLGGTAVSGEESDDEDGGMSFLDFLSSAPPSTSKPKAAPSSLSSSTPSNLSLSGPSHSRQKSTEVNDDDDDGMSLVDFLAKSAPTRKDSSTGPPRTQSPKPPSDDKDRGTRADGIKRATSGPINSSKIVSHVSSLSGTSQAPLSERGASSNTLMATPKAEKPSEAEEEKEMKTCTIQELIAEVTGAAPAHQTLFEFLLTYRSIVKPGELVDLIISRFEQVAGDPKANVIRLRCINFFRNWIDKNWFDFSKDQDILTPKLEVWAASLAKDPQYASVIKAAEGLIERLHKVIEEPPKPVAIGIRTEPPEMIPNLPLEDGQSLSLLHIDPEELARQMTLIDEELWGKIQPWELLGQAWMKEEKAEKSPNVLAMIVRFNTVNRWVQALLLTEEDLETRITILKHIVRTLYFLLEYRNFNGALQIVSALNSSAVFRLKKTFEALSEKELAELDLVKEVVSRENNYKNLREVLARVVPPCIPYLGMYLTDLIFIEDGQKSTTPEGLINFQKRRQIASVIRVIQALQGERYSLTPLPEIQNMMKNVEVFDDDTNYQLSQYIEPRGGAEPTGPKPEWLRKSPLPPNYKLRSVKKALSKGASTTSLTSSNSSKRGSSTSKPGPNASPLTRKKSYAQPKSTSKLKVMGGTNTGSTSIPSASGEDSSETASTTSEPLKPPQVEDSSFNEIIAQVTPVKPDPATISEMLLTYRSICGAEELLNAIIKRFKSVSGPEARAIQSSCISFISTWKNDYWYDFSKDRGALIMALQQFNEQVHNTAQFEASQVELKNLIITLANPGVIAAKPVGQPPSPILPPATISAPLDLDPLELARQLTIFDEEAFGDLRPWELLNIAWTRPSRERDAPNVSRLLLRQEELKGFLCTTVLAEDSSKQRKKFLKFWISVCAALKELKNYFSLCPLLEGLNSPPIQRLKKLWGSVDKAQMKQLQDLTASVDPKVLKADMSKAKLPALPHLGPYLGALLAIEDSHAMFGQETNELINFSKRREIAAVLKELMRFQSQLYSLELVRSIRAYIETFHYVSDKVCEQLSLYLEPAPGAAKMTKPREMMTRAELLQAGIYFCDEDWQAQYSVIIPSDYPFKDKDDDSTITLGNKRGAQVVLGATLPKLIERLTIAPAEMLSLPVFLLTFRQFICEPTPSSLTIARSPNHGTPASLFELLCARFRVPMITSSDKKVWQNFNKAVVEPIQDRVIGMFTMWVSDHFDDFKSDSALLAKLKTFISDTLVVVYPSLGQKILQLVESGGSQPDLPKSLSNVKGALPSKPVAECFVSDFDLVEVARQICLVDQKRFAAIPPSELLNLAYNVSGKSPHLHTFKASSEALSRLISSEILATPLEQRNDVILKWLVVMNHLKTFKNWNAFAGCTEALSPYLNAPFITDALVGSMLEEAHRLFHDSKHYLKLKSRLYDAMAAPPSLPYLKPLLEDLEYIEKTRHPDEFLRITNWTVKVINFLRLSDAIEFLTKLIFPSQRSPYSFRPVALIQEWYTAGATKKPAIIPRPAVAFKSSLGASMESDEALDSDEDGVTLNDEAKAKGSSSDAASSEASESHDPQPSRPVSSSPALGKPALKTSGESVPSITVPDNIASLPATPSRTHSKPLPALPPRRDSGAKTSEPPATTSTANAAATPIPSALSDEGATVRQAHMARGFVMGARRPSSTPAPNPPGKQ